MSWQPARDGALAVVGGPGSGRSTTLATLADAATEVGMAVVAVTAEGSPLGLLATRRTDGRATALVTAADPDHRDDVLTRLRARTAGGSDEWVLVCLDDADDALAPDADPQLLDTVTALVREGGRARVAVALSGGRLLAGSRLGSHAGLRLVHRFPDPGDAGLAGADRRLLGAGSPAGRGVLVGWASEPHADSAGGSGPPLVQVALPDSVGAAWRSPVLAAPLPSRLLTTECPAPTWRRLPVGACPDGDRTAALDLDATPLVAVVGPPGSGRSTTLTALGTQARAAGAVVHRASADDDTAALLDRLAEPDRPPLGQCSLERHHRPVLVLLDDLEEVAATLLDRLTALAEQLLREAASSPATARPGVALAVGAGVETMAAGFRGLPAVVRRGGTGIVLWPARTDARDVLGVRDAPRQLVRWPGRGLLVVRGRARRLHVALAPQATPAPGAAPAPQAAPAPEAILAPQSAPAAAQETPGDGSPPRDGSLLRNGP